MNFVKNKWKATLVSIVAVFMLIMGRFILHNRSVEEITTWIPLFCPFKLITKLSCPGCGITHSILSLLKGDISMALGYHPFVPIFLLLCVILIFKLDRIISNKVLNGIYLSTLSMLIIWWVGKL